MSVADPHAETKAATLQSVAECEGWIAEAKRQGDAGAIALGLSRLRYLTKGARHG